MVRLHNLTAPFVFAATMLAGCGGSQPTIGISGVMPQGGAITQQAARGKSWMLPEAKKEDLLYVADWGCGCLRVFSYPKGKPVGVAQAAPELQGACADGAGNIWVTSFRLSEILEFAHGGTRPIAVLTEDRNTGPWSCSVDPVTGDLAVTNTNETIAVFPHAQGSPTIYRGLFNYCTYDADGNLFADWDGPEGLFELPRGGKSFSEISLNRTIVGESIQWDGENLAIVSGGRIKKSQPPVVLYRVHVSGTTGTIVGRTILRGHHDYSTFSRQFWVQRDTIVGPGPTPNDQTALLNFWHYPAGKPKKSIEVQQYDELGPPGLTGVTVSLAQK